MDKILPVTVDAWQFGCCGGPFMVGDDVRWQLVLSVGAVGPPFARTTLAGVATTAVDSIFQDPGSNLDCGDGLVVYVEATQKPGQQTLIGCLAEEHHGRAPESTPRVPGTVVRMRAVSVDYEKHDGAYVALPDTERYRDVNSLDEWLNGPASTLVVDFKVG